MPPDQSLPTDLVDLKLLPAWVKETPEPNAYAHYEGEEAGADRRGGRGRPHDRKPRDNRRPPGAARRPERDGRGPQGDRRVRDRREERGGARRPGRHQHGPERREQRPPERPPLHLVIRFLPHAAAFDNVAAQIKGDLLAYSVFSLARLFLQKPERYDVEVTAKPETPLFQLGESGPVSADRAFLENNAFRFAQKDFYKIDISQSEPIKGNFSSIARERTSGTMLGPTNYHDYQRKLRGLYEQRFSRRMSFADFQRQIEIVNDPALVEQWKEEARSVTTFTTLSDEPAQSFTNPSEAERHFRTHHLSTLVRQIEQTRLDGVASRNLPDRFLRRAIEEAWSVQTRSPSQMMAELSTRLREAGLHIFRHRKGMLFVSPVRVRPFVHDQTNVSGQVRAILDAVAANPKINRKDLAEKVIVNVASDDLEARKLSLASDLKWLISEGYLIEFNDGSLDLPRAKVKPVQVPAADAASAEQTAPPAESNSPVVASEASSLETSATDEPAPVDVKEAVTAVVDEAEIGGS